MKQSRASFRLIFPPVQAAVIYLKLEKAPCLSNGKTFVSFIWCLEKNGLRTFFMNFCPYQNIVYKKVKQM